MRANEGFQEYRGHYFTDCYNGVAKCNFITEAELKEGKCLFAPPPPFLRKISAVMYETLMTCNTFETLSKCCVVMMQFSVVTHATIVFMTNPMF